MPYFMLLVLLLAAALLEAGGDAIVRMGIRASAGWTRVLTLAAGGLTLLLYGCIVNAVPWDFGRLIGVYVVFFFLVAQAIAWVAFGQFPSPGIWLGGALIVIGGALVSVSGTP